jgi:HSP20 family protein
MALKSLIPVGRERRSQPAALRPFYSLQREIDRLFDEFGRGFPDFAFGVPDESFGADITPRMNVSETDKAIELTGLEKGDVELNVADDVLTIRGEKKVEKDETKKDYRLIERSYGSFARRLQLPTGVDPAAITAEIANGVLKVTVPKPAPAVTKRIDVKPAA